MKCKTFRFLNLVLASFLASHMRIAARESQAATPVERDAAVASRWWPEMENVWTPIGWKDRFLRANVLYNGMVVIEPRHQPYKGKGVQIEFIPSRDGAVPKPSAGVYHLLNKYGPTGNQGWNPETAPVLWTQWNRGGLVLCQEIFGHVASGGDVGKEVKPLYFWIRLSILTNCATAIDFSKACTRSLRAACRGRLTSAARRAAASAERCSLLRLPSG